jgi:hypothetical protein
MESRADEQTPDDSDRLLRIYLQDHWAGSTVGLSLAQRCRRENPALDDALGELERGIAEDRETLAAIMARLQVPPSRVKSTLGAVGEVFGRVKTNGRLVRYSPLSRVLELEALAGGVLAKRQLWRSLAEVAHGHPVLDTAELDRLIDRANSQLDLIVAVHARAVDLAFASQRAAVRSSA